MGSFFDGLFGTKDNDMNNKNETKSDGKLELRQEELDISKNKVQSGEVTLSKDIIEEEKTVDVPVMHEEVVIERKALDHEPSDTPITSGETIRIPVSEEKVEVGKHTVLTGEVTAHIRRVDDTKTVKETLKKEEAHIDRDGDTNIVSENSVDESTEGFF